MINTNKISPTTAKSATLGIHVFKDEGTSTKEVGHGRWEAT
jgi:hypothetical protein